jgi:YVTN family beta-propeller protein
MDRRNRHAVVLLALAAALAMLPLPSAAQLRIFVANSGDDTVSVIDDDLEREVQTIHVGNFPQGLALRQTDPLLAVANSRGNSVTLINPVSLEKVADPIDVGRFPFALKFSADGQQLFCGNYDDRAVSVLDVRTHALVGEPIPIGAPPMRLALSPDGAFLYALRYQQEGGVVVADTRTHAVLKTIPLDPFPTDLVLQPDGKRLFVASFNAATVTIVDVARLEPVDTLDVRTGDGLLIHPRKPLLYSMVTFDDEVSVFDYTQKKELAAIAVGQKPIYSAMSPDGRLMYVVNGSDNNVMKIDTDTNTVKLRIAVGIEPTDAVVFEMPRDWRVASIATGAAAFLAVALGGAIVLRRRRARTTK